ncbi:radial spoke head 14 homolog [Megalobrama amblycephala]|uniref:radial spoke head 14 homolog n=1 Tax=Megalobrama amblycephala TaxID=75352 RepID=UPI0020147189|nr:radial spoke head 14 homolog [Megalobrama amblycephala]XP_048065121.1 radial spoke head 14 homolog [Megalobrama amblycephala]XP_048065122.1 radial spoke head 14 homolog [Megalobrama amblycephala]
MASPQTSEQPPPHIDPTQAPVAFGNWALPKLIMELQDVELFTRQRALAALCDLVHDHERAYEAILNGCMERLKVLLQDEDNLIRVKTTEVLYVLASHSLGRDAFLKFDIVGPLANLLEDPENACRKNVHQALNRIAEFPSGAVFMVCMGLVPRLVMKVSDEEENIRALILSTLSCCVSVNALPALESDAILVLRDQLSHPSPAIRQAATSALVGISVPADGKMKVCEEDLLPMLVKLLSDDDQGVVANAAGTIMNTAVITKGKSEALNAGAIAPLLRLVVSENVAVCANALRALTVLAEVPRARAQLLEHVPLLKTRLAHPNSIIQRAASTAIEVISWKP